MVFHGCDKSIRDGVINGDSLKKSVNSYDWLGSGIYFWKNDPDRAYDWALQLLKRKQSSIKTPAVIGAVIDSGNCLDLMKLSSTEPLRVGYQLLKESYEKKEKELPKNINLGSNTDILLRYLDCAVINQFIDFANESDNFNTYDSVRGYFTEGDYVYPGATF